MTCTQLIHEGSEDCQGALFCRREGMLAGDVLPPELNSLCLRNWVGRGVFAGTYQKASAFLKTIELMVLSMIKFKATTKGVCHICFH